MWKPDKLKLNRRNLPSINLEVIEPLLALSVPRTKTSAPTMTAPRVDSLVLEWEAFVRELAEIQWSLTEFQKRSSGIDRKRLSGLARQKLNILGQNSKHCVWETSIQLITCCSLLSLMVTGQNEGEAECIQIQSTVLSPVTWDCIAFRSIQPRQYISGLKFPSQCPDQKPTEHLWRDVNIEVPPFFSSHVMETNYPNTN